MKRIISVLLVLVTVCTLLPASVLAVFADTRTELEVTWNAGYVGCATNKNKNKIVAGNSLWQYTDIITVPKAGTKISFDVPSGSLPTNAVYVFSTWKKSGSDWIVDLDGANVTGTDKYEFIGQKDGHYEFVTDHDDQSIRLCTKSGSFKVYTEETTDASTLDQLKALDFTATLNDNGTVDGIRWFCGYASSATNTNGSAKEIKYFSAASANSYAMSNLILIPKKGTKISYTLQSSTNDAYNAFTVYKKDGEHYVYDFGYAATNSLVANGNTFTYVTSNDNEVIRLCCRPNVSYGTVYLSTAPVTVTWSATTEAGTATNKQETVWPDPELYSLVTGAQLIGTKIDLNWTSGYVGSQYQDDAAKRLTYTSPSNQYYYTSDAFTVPKAGTTVYFFDQNFTDFGGSKYATVSVLTVSHWKHFGTHVIFDKTKEYLTGCEVYQLDLYGDYRSYAYTTKEDNEIIRLCMRYAPMYAGEEAKIPPVYLVEPTDFSTELGTADENGLIGGSYTDPSGATVNYRYYLPYGNGTAEKQYSLILDTTENGEIAEYLAQNGVKNAIVLAIASRDTATVGRLLDEFVKHYPVKTSDLLFVGGKELGEYAAKFESIRLCNAMLYTDETGAPSLNYAAVKPLSELDGVKQACDWLLGNYDDYYTVLDGLKMYAIGDSYFGGSGLGQHQTWVNLLGYKYGMTFHNYGIGGNQVAKITVNPDANSPSMCERYTELPTDGDIYFVEGGRNDRHHSVPFGTTDSTDITTYSGALNKIIGYITENAPNALIVLVTPWSYKTEKGYLGTNNDYADAMKALAESYNTDRIVCLYAADTEWTGIDMSDAKCRQKYCLTASDVSHLNANGMYMIAPKFEAWIAEKYATFKQLSLVNDADDTELFTKGAEDSGTADPGNSDSGEPTDSVSNTEKVEDGASCSCASGAVQILAIVCGILGMAITVVKKVR